MGSVLPQSVFDRLRAMCSGQKQRKPKAVVIPRLRLPYVKIVLEDIECHHCRTSFARMRVDQVYCTGDCRKRAGRLRKRDSLIRSFRVTTACVGCGVEFTPLSRLVRYCSDACCLQEHANRRSPANTKTCIGCKKLFITRYSLKTYCNSSCRSKKVSANKRHSNRSKIIAMKKTLSCGKCGENHPACLDFHHRDPKTKLFTISHATRHHIYSWETILVEIDKCDVICSNCHRKEHWANPIASDIRMEKEPNVRKED